MAKSNQLTPLPFKGLTVIALTLMVVINSTQWRIQPFSIFCVVKISLHINMNAHIINVFIVNHYYISFSHLLIR